MQASSVRPSDPMNVDALSGRDLDAAVAQKCAPFERHPNFALNEMCFAAPLPSSGPPPHLRADTLDPSEVSMRALVLPACLLLVAIPVLHSQAAPASTPTTLHWGPAPAVFPMGAQMAVVSGDPGKAAPFTVELSMPDGYKILPHFHPTDETVKVKKGTFLFGMGDVFDATKTKSMAVGDSGFVPANAHHFAVTKGATIVSVSGMGPFVLTYVNPADDPQKPAAKP